MYEQDRDDDGGYSGRKGHERDKQPQSNRAA